MADIELTSASPETLAAILAALGAPSATVSLRYPSDEVSPPTPVVGNVAARAGKLLGFDETGAPANVTPPDSGGPTWSPVDTETGNRTLALTDAGKYIRLTHASAAEITVPPQSDVAWAADTEIQFRVASTATITVTPGSGVTVNNAAAAGDLEQHATFALKRVAEDVWDLI